MTVSVAAPGVRTLSLRIIDRAGTVSDLQGRARDYGRFVRLATAGALIYAMFPVAADIAYIATVFGEARNGWWALVAAVCYLPLHLRNVWYGTRSMIPPGGTASLSVMVVVIIGALPLAGDAWIREFGGLAVSAWIVLRPPWSRIAVALSVLVPIVLALAWVEGPDAWWIGLQPFFRALFLFGLVWLAAAVRQLQHARQVLADQALARQRDRIDSELQRSVGVALESIMVTGQRAASKVGSGDPTLMSDLRELANDSRSTLAKARQMISGYQRSSLGAELDMAATLLTAAGIKTVVMPYSGRLPDGVEESTRDLLRAVAADLLRDRTARSCTITVTSEGRLRLDVHIAAVSGGVVSDDPRTSSP